MHPPLYSSYHLSFTSNLPRSLLEELASLILSHDPSGSTGQLISSVYDQYLDFLVPSTNLFSLLPRRELQSQANGVGTNPKSGKLAKDKEVEGRPSYAVLNDPRAGELDIEEEVERIARGLFSVVITMSEYGEEILYELRNCQTLSRLFDAQEGTRPRWSLENWMLS